jgi:hypothetical protein
MIKYGLISETDARTLEKTIDLICRDIYGTINVTEVGLYNCETSNGISDYTWQQHKVRINYTGIDCEKDKLIHPPDWMHFIRGNSNEVYNQLEDNSQHLIFVDGCHCFAHVVSDFFCYAQKVKRGGYIAFHDTGRHIKPFKDFQHGDKENPDAYISVRKALLNIGLFGDVEIETEDTSHRGSLTQWELIFDEADETDEAGGICVFKKLY